MSTSYNGFPYIYEQYYEIIPYSEWSDYLCSLLRDIGISSGRLVELGCGTATLANYMSLAGYDVIRIDNSIDMLTIAADKTAGNPHIQLLQQDMRQFDPGDNSYPAIYCLCDSLNYLLTAEDVSDTFHCVRTALDHNGIFIFDLKTEYFYKEILGDQIFCDHQEQGSYIWENSYFEDDHINQYELTFFAKEENGLYRKFCETHHQKDYSLSEMIDLLHHSGLEYVTAYDAFTKMPPHSDSERIYIIARNGDN